MKKIFKVTNWDDSDFTSVNVLNKTHWFIKALDTCLGHLDIGEYTITYDSKRKCVLTTVNYGTFDIYRPMNIKATPYIIYVNSENKEMFGCCSLETPFTVDINSLDNSRELFNSASGNALRGNYFVTNNGYTTSLNIAGGYLGLKFKQTEGIVGWSSSIPEIVPYILKTHSFNTITNVNCPLNSMDGAYTQPLTPIDIRGYNTPILKGIGTSNSCAVWRGEMFESIFDAETYYLGALKNSDNTKFYYNGYIFYVDDATDIGIIETTI